MKIYIIILLLFTVFLNGCFFWQNQYTEEHANRYVAVWLEAGKLIDTKCKTAAKLYLRKEMMNGKITEKERQKLLERLELK